MGVAFEKVVFNRPDVIKAQLIGNAALLQRVLVDRKLISAGERTRCGQFEENSEFDGVSPLENA